MEAQSESSQILNSPVKPSSSKVLGKLLSLISVHVEPVGRWFEAHAARRNRTHSQSHGSLTAEESSSSESEEELVEEEEDEAFLLTLDPKEWKNQDHYAVIGLGKSRYKATTAQIKVAYKRKVLRHHPDKRKARGEEIKDESKDYFPCITRAWEVLGDPVKRISYDSVDPQFDDAIPCEKEFTGNNFYQLFRPVFEQNSRWSKRKPVPELGNDEDGFDVVDRFYGFWYEFDSWREYSYLDEEDKERGEDRYERRFIEKQNKDARKKRKKEEMTRIRQLVDLAHKLDPRVIRFREEAKRRKEDEKQAKRDLARKKAEEEERVKREAQEKVQKQRDEEEAAAKEQAAQAKKEREAQKKVIKKERKILRNVVKEEDFYCAGDDSVRVSHMAEVDRLAELLDVLQLQDLNEKIRSSDDKGKQAFIDAVQSLNSRMEEEKHKAAAALQSQQQPGAAGGKKRTKNWSQTEIQALIRAMQLVPQGTADRWEVVAQFMAQHCPGCKRTSKETLAMSKELQHSDLASALKEDMNRRAFEKTVQQKKEREVQNMKDPEDISERYMTAGEQQAAETGSNPAPWTADEQKLLEQALRKFPASAADRWGQIAAMLPARSKRDCMLRYKELVELVKAKKAAAAKGAKS